MSRGWSSRFSWAWRLPRALGVAATLCTIHYAALPPWEAFAATIEIIRASEPGKSTTLIIVEGELIFGYEKKFVEAAIGLDSAIVVLAGPGGNLFAGIKIGEAIQIKEFQTVVIDTTACASA